MKNSLFKILFILLFLVCLVGCKNEEEVLIIEEKKDISEAVSSEPILVKKIDNSNYEFEYNGEVFKVYYVIDTWKIYDSYKITNTNDMKRICKALIEIHPIHGADMVSYRTEKDMVYEWVQHNIAYEMLPEGNSFRNSAKDVDLDPRDQGKSLVEIYEDRTGKKIDLGNILKNKKTS